MSTIALDQLLISQPPRENAGSRSSNRFAFQNDWALCHLLTLHENDADYLLVFDYHDDVLELDAEIDPSSVKFYQIKSNTTKAHWTPAQLLSRKSGKEGPKLSYLGKLYHHTTLFADRTDGLFFVSNLPLKAELSDESDSTTKARLPFKDLSSSEQTNVAAKLKKEHGLSADPSLDELCFLVTPLSVTDHQTHSLGHVTNFLSKHLVCDSVPAKAFLETLKGEIERCANWEYQPTDWKSFCEKKGISRSRMNKFLEPIEFRADWKSVSDLYVPQLEKDGWSFVSCERLRKALRSVEVELMNPDDILLGAAKEGIEDSYAVLLSSPDVEELKLGDFLEKLTSSPAQSVVALKQRKPIEYIQALCLVCIYEKAR
jgi:hypothetical protein